MSYMTLLNHYHTEGIKEIEVPKIVSLHGAFYMDGVWGSHCMCNCSWSMYRDDFGKAAQYNKMSHLPIFSQMSAWKSKQPNGGYTFPISKHVCYLRLLLQLFHNLSLSLVTWPSLRSSLKHRLLTCLVRDFVSPLHGACAWHLLAQNNPSYHMYCLFLAGINLILHDTITQWQGMIKMVLLINTYVPFASCLLVSKDSVGRNWHRGFI